MSESRPAERERFPLNSAGDFYVENGVCLCCGIPDIDAPELMGFDNQEMHCYFKRQPLTAEELEHAINAVADSDIRGLRYAGTDKDILARLVKLQAAESCDALASKQPRGLREYVKVCWKKLFSPQKGT